MKTRKIKNNCQHLKLFVRRIGKYVASVILLLGAAQFALAEHGNDSSKPPNSTPNTTTISKIAPELRLVGPNVKLDVLIQFKNYPSEDDLERVGLDCDMEENFNKTKSVHLILPG